MPDVSLWAWLVFPVPLLYTPKLILECQQSLCRMTALVMGQALSQAGQHAQVTEARPAITQEGYVHSGTWKSSPRVARVVSQGLWWGLFWLPIQGVQTGRDTGMFPKALLMETKNRTCDHNAYIFQKNFSKTDSNFIISKYIGQFDFR